MSEGFWKDHENQGIKEVPSAFGALYITGCGCGAISRGALTKEALAGWYDGHIERSQRAQTSFRAAKDVPIEVRKRIRNVIISDMLDHGEEILQQARLAGDTPEAREALAFLPKIQGYLERLRPKT